ncbi:MAG: GspMb/PilO family protein [Pseudomonadota bacterium]
MSEFRFPNPSRAKLAFGAFATVVALGLGTLGLEAIAAINALETEIEDQKALLSRARLAEAPAQAIDAYRASTAEEARARFQTDLQGLADEAGLAIETLDTAELVLVNGMVRMGITIKGSIIESELATLLVALDAARPFMLVEGITLRRARGQRSKTTPRELPIRLEIAAYAAV